ncbi:MAG TPA: type 4a pilus biogenesis protein PilO [Polyangiaceae bacterium]|jgi:type IV pilus assembly protein PilO|nr:type 4a pilus biogenesis protein PilO [Polyangiaceae bacterium]
MAINRGTLSRLALPAKLGIGAGTLALVGAGYYFIFHAEVDEGLTKAKAANSSLNADLTKARTAEQAYQKDLAELADREQRQKELNQILPATTEYPAFLSAVQSAANVSGVSLAAWTPREKVPDKYYAKVPMKVELTGKFMQVARFFYNVGQLDRIINMENISMTDPRLVDDEVVLKTEALATAFHVVEEKPAAAGKSGGK